MHEFSSSSENAYFAKRSFQVDLTKKYYLQEINNLVNLFQVNGELSLNEKNITAWWISEYRFGIITAMEFLNIEKPSEHLNFRLVSDYKLSSINKLPVKDHLKSVAYYSTDLEYSGLAVKKILISRFLPEYENQINLLYKDVVSYRKKQKMFGKKRIAQNPVPSTIAVLGLSVKDLRFIINTGWLTSLVKSVNTKNRFNSFKLGGIQSLKYSDLFLIAGFEEGAHYVYKYVRQKHHNS